MKKVWRARSLQARLLAMVLSLVTVVWLCAAMLTWVDTSHELDELLDAHLAQSAALLVLEADGDEDDVGDIPFFNKYTQEVGFQVFIAGKLVTRSLNAGTVPMSAVTEGLSTVRMPSGDYWRVIGVQLPSRSVQAFVGERVESRRAILWALLRNVLWPLLIALPLLAVAIWWSVHAGLAPLRDLSRLLGKRRPQALNPVVLQDMPDEMRPMVEELNQLLERIGGMVLTERRFTADAAHELRTPIAAIRAQAQVALGAGDDVPQRNHALQATLAGCDRATRLVEQLLMLARLEAQGVPTAMPVNLCAVVRRMAAELAPAALARAQSLEVEGDDVCNVAADETLLGVLVRNLVDNALRYSPAGARVLVTLQPSAKGVELCVQDSGPGMAPAEMQRLGERFFRVLGTDQPGSGLGWSIVKRIADVTGAGVQIARSQALGGLAVTVVWPT
jgi:two-component system sensor histidine kinase QseC